MRIAWVLAFALVIAPATPVIAAPPGHIVRVGILGQIDPTFDPASNAFARELVAGLRELGYLPGRDVVFEYRSAHGNTEAMPGLAIELVSLKPDMILAPRPGAILATMAAERATTTIPIVMIGAEDAVETGLVKSLARPGGNITGLAVNAAEIAAKRVQLLKEAVPHLSRVAVLWNATLKGMALGYQNIENASPQLGVTIQSIRVGGSEQFPEAFAAIENGQPDGLVVLYGPLRGDDLPRIVKFVTQRRLPTVFELGRGASGGGLMEFGPDASRMARRAAFYIDKIANGAKPADLPVEEPSEFELVVNLKAAKEMGFVVPHSLLLRADRIIE
ncbi:MAG: ABC transporter substrate-binding protein [Thiohalocapsa sp.]